MWRGSVTCRSGYNRRMTERDVLIERLFRPDGTAVMRSPLGAEDLSELREAVWRVIAVASQREPSLHSRMRLISPSSGFRRLVARSTAWMCWAARPSCSNPQPDAQAR